MSEEDFVTCTSQMGKMILIDIAIQMYRVLILATYSKEYLVQPTGEKDMEPQRSHWLSLVPPSSLLYL